MPVVAAPGVAGWESAGPPWACFTSPCPYRMSQHARTLDRRVSAAVARLVGVSMIEAKTTTAHAPVSKQRLERMRRAVADWATQLIDLTGRNQLLYYRTLKRGTLELSKAVEVPLETLLSGRTVRLSQLLPGTDEQPGRFDDALARARTVHGRALALFEERGIQTLFLAWGMATWRSETSAATPAAPVLLRPLRIEPRGAAEADFDVHLDGDWQISETLLHLLATNYHLAVDVSTLLEAFEESDDGTGPDPTGVFDLLCKEAADVPDFTVVKRVVVGTFSYTKLPMVQNLQDHIEELAAHDLIAAISGDAEAVEAVQSLHARDIDAGDPDRTPPADEFLILDADSSQNRAINAVIAGEPLIIQGPPGTGKSQSIANLIATLTARGKRVLFVAEKRAAIDAVTKRLDAVGLGDLVMDLHGGVTSKKQLAAGLGVSLDRMGKVPQPDVAALHRSLVATRQHLTDHDEAMHTPREPWDLTLWQMNEQLLALPAEAHATRRLPASKILDLDADSAEQIGADLEEWSALTAPIRDQASPWASATIRTTEDANEAIEIADALAAEIVPQTRRRLDAILAETGLPAPDTLEDWQRTLTLLTGVAETLAVVRSDVWGADLDALSDALAPGERSWWTRMNAQLFDGRYRTAKREVRDLWRDGKPTGRDAEGLVAAARDQQEEWRSLGGQGAPRVGESLEEAYSAYGRLTNRLAALGAYLVTRNLYQRSHHHIAEDVSALASDHTTVYRLPRIHELEQLLTARDCAWLLEAVRTGALDGEVAVEAFTHVWLASIRDHLTATDRRLSAFDGGLHRRRADQYADADRRHIDTSADRVRRAVAERAVAARGSHPEQDRVVVGQSKRKRGHMTLRQLFDTAPDVLTALRPCWVMSPLVVSQTLPARQVFDVVIFDEASQVTPADAIPALLRASQAVVAGDERQLPPTDFFGLVGGAADDGDGDDDDGGIRLTTGYESVLDVLGVLLRPYMLTWHYRSEDERLIAFSNHHIYDGLLTTFPGIAGDACLSHELIPHRAGVMSNSNDDEVARVVELMIDHARGRPGESLGVIAMSLKHAARIEAALWERIADEGDPAIEAFFDEQREERAFVKNLERVQGDERDAIILTTGYAKADDGRMRYRFGPLNTEGGERRLNVAVTRARRRMTVVSSFSHTDMDPDRLSARGAQLLRTFLKYVESGGTDLEGAQEAVELNAFEVSVKRSLEDAGLKVIPQYGTSGFRIDFAICHPTEPGRLVLAVEADGASYHSSKTARDRDRLRQQILERFGWRFHRIWSTDWFNNPHAETQRLLAAYQDTLMTPLRPAGLEPPSAKANTAPPTAKALRPEPRPSVPPGFKITEYSHAELVALARWTASDTLLRTEDQMLTEMMRELGFQKRGSRIVAALTDAIRALG